MSEESSVVADGFEDVGFVDPDLETLVKFAELDINFEITIWVQGRIISGQLIGRKKYLALIRDMFTGTVSDAKNKFAEYIQRSIDDIPDQTPDTINDYQTGFLHIAQPYFVNENPAIPSKPLRCKISSVDAFYYGRLEPNIN